MLNFKYNETHAVINTEGSDGYERYYLEKGTSNRMYLSLRSEIPSETDWALSRLLHLSSEFVSEFSIKDVDGLIEALLEFPLNASKQLVHTNDTYALKNILHQACDAITVILNLATIDTNLHVIHTYHRTLLGLCQRYLRIGEKTDVANEITVKLLSVLESVAELLVDIPKNPLLGMLAHLVYSHDRAYMLIALRMMSVFASKNNHTKRFEELAVEIYAHVVEISLIPDPYLRAAALEFMYATASTIPEILKMLLTYKDLPILIKSLAYMLYDETVEEFRKDEFIDTGIERPLRPLPRLLSDEDKERIGMMTEPNRSQEWIKAVFEEKPGAEFEQSKVYPLYEQTLSKYAYHTRLQSEDNLVNLFPATLKSSKSVTRDGTPLIKNVKLRSKRSLYTCYWGDDRSEFNSAEQLFRYIVAKYIDIPESPVTFTWDTELFSIDSTSAIPHSSQLKAKVLSLMAVAQDDSEAVITVPNTLEEAKNPTKRTVIRAFPHDGVSYTVLHVPCDKEGFPRGIAYQAALLIRLMAQKSNPYAKNVQQTDEANRPESKGYFGLPIPTNFEEQQNSQIMDDDQSELYPNVTHLLSLFARRPLADVGIRNVSQLAEVCLEAFEFIQNENFGSLIVESV